MLLGTEVEANRRGQGFAQGERLGLRGREVGKHIRALQMGAAGGWSCCSFQVKWEVTLRVVVPENPSFS